MLFWSDYAPDTLPLYFYHASFGLWEPCCGCHAGELSQPAQQHALKGQPAVLSLAGPVEMKRRAPTSCLMSWPQRLRGETLVYTEHRLPAPDRHYGPCQATFPSVATSHCTLLKSPGTWVSLCPSACRRCPCVLCAPLRGSSPHGCSEGPNSGADTLRAAASSGYDYLMKCSFLWVELGSLEKHLPGGHEALGSTQELGEKKRLHLWPQLFTWTSGIRRQHGHPYPRAQYLHGLCCCTPSLSLSWCLNTLVKTHNVLSDHIFDI